MSIHSNTSSETNTHNRRQVRCRPRIRSCTEFRLNDRTIPAANVSCSVLPSVEEDDGGHAGLRVPVGQGLCVITIDHCADGSALPSVEEDGGGHAGFCVPVGQGFGLGFLRCLDFRSERADRLPLYNNRITIA